MSGPPTLQAAQQPPTPQESVATPDTGEDAERPLIEAGTASRSSRDGRLSVYDSEDPGSACSVLAFVEGKWYQDAVALGVLANVVQLAVATDWPNWAWWPLLDNVLLAGIATDLALRVSYYGKHFYARNHRSWGVFDTSVVLSVFLTACLQPMLASRQSSGYNPSVLFRIARFAWTLRAFRIFPRLEAFLYALLGMMSTFVWIFSVLFLFCLLCAILCTQILGHGGYNADNNAANEEHIRQVQRQFGSVHESLFSLFQVTTQDNWVIIAAPAVALMPGMRLFFVGFIIFCSWTMISILTAVASDSMIEATTDRKEMEAAAQVKKQQHFIQFLRHCFVEGDVDGSGDLDKAEFEALVQQPHVIREMQSLGGALTAEELMSAWKMLDVANAGVLTIQEFVEGIAYLQDTLTTKHVINVENKVKRIGCKIRKAFNALEEELEVVRAQHKEIAQLATQRDAFVASVSGHLEVWHEWAQKCDAKALSLAASAANGAFVGENRELPRSPSSTPSLGKRSGSFGQLLSKGLR